MEDVVSFIEYEKISDVLLYLGNNTNLSFNVKLAKKGMDGRRYHFYKEYRYDSNYINKDKVSSIKRNFEYYISIENTKDKDFFCMITVSDILLFRAKLNQTIKWLDGSVNTFAIKRNKLVLLGKHDPIDIDLVTKTNISFEPVVIINANDQQSQGIRISMKNKYIDVNANVYMGLVYLINSINMYESAQILINYLPSPDYGGDVYSFSNENEEVKDTCKKRFPPKKEEGGSFFSNKLDNM